ncbi:hypothetical protein GWE18_00445 [Bradyrhizobium sp. CSA112]|uniref:hypothetical protein n=1 Tax=Bradyrhizobium sp. CSA112 TaxID=2699170 RepID=UPI0023AFF1F4|nr:hypothetical protein [Bradyrhizobium sp. CSA112]MDE5451345.1 hypothetical protein [Bradyrhizobium sp. CSA112]
MWTAIIAFFKAIPAITGGITAFTQAYYNAKVQIIQARVGGDVEVAKQLATGIVAEGQTRVEFLKVVAQSKFLMFLVGGFAFPWMFYQAKVVMWDKIICKWVLGVYGYTPPVDGSVGEWAGWIIGGIFGTGGVMALGQMFYNRRER